VSTQTHPSQRVDVIGSGGELTIHLPFNAYPDVPLQFTVSTGVGTRNISAPVSDQYVEMFEAFSLAVREGGSVPTPPQDAIANTKVLDALSAGPHSCQMMRSFTCDMSAARVASSPFSSRYAKRLARSGSTCFNSPNDFLTVA